MQVLDDVMYSRLGSHPDFECSHLDYCSLLAIKQQDLQLMVTPDLPATQWVEAASIEARWQRVIDLFAQRYGLWPV